MTDMAEVYVRVHYRFSVDDGGEVDGVFDSLDAAKEGHDGWELDHWGDWRCKGPTSYSTLIISKHEVLTSWSAKAQDLGCIDEAGDARERIGLPPDLDWEDLERRSAEAAASALTRGVKGSATP